MNRAERRRQEKQDEKAVARGLDVAGRSGQQTASLMRVLHGEVSKAVRIGNLKGLFNFLYDNLTKTNSQAPWDLVACRQGCSHCCHMWVSATAPEILLIAATLRQRRSDVAPVLERAARTLRHRF